MAPFEVEMNSKPVKKVVKYNDSPVETAGEMLREPVKELAKMPASIFGTALEQVGFKPRKTLSGTIEITRKVTTQIEQPPITAEQSAPASKEPVKNFEGGRLFQSQKSQEKVIFNQKNQEIEKQIQQILNELKSEVSKLSSQAAGLSADVKKITVESAPASAGQYHINFFEMLIRELKNIRKKVSQSRMWLNATYAKKQQKGFWAQAKKKGNQFLLSEERTAGYGAG